jgi:hypothetical protein
VVEFEEVLMLELNAERARLAEAHENTRPWYYQGPYISERQWGTVREDYSASGNAWDFFPHDHARSRTYRWGEDGLLGISDEQCRLCFALSLWNEADAILKELLYGLSGPECNHGDTGRGIVANHQTGWTALEAKLLEQTGGR